LLPPRELSDNPLVERKLVTVIFADLVGSIGLADQKDPERMRAVLDRFYDAMATEIEGAGGTVEKFAGDAVMAAFGAPAAQEDHAERALHAALSIRHRLDTLFDGRLALRIGVNTGDVVSGRRRAFVGRDEDLGRVHRAFRECATRREATLVTVIGEAGVGKTRLVRELWERLADEAPEPLRRTGRCLAYGRGITYWPLGEILKEHLGILESDEPDRVRSQLAGREILGLTLGLDVAGDLHPLAARDRLQEAWVDLLEELSAERPVVVLVEDLHWAED